MLIIPEIHFSTYVKSSLHNSIIILLEKNNENCYVYLLGVYKIDNKKNLRETIQFYLIDCKTIIGKFIDIFIIFLNLLVCIVFVAETYPISEQTRKILDTIELVVVLFFMIEYIFRLYGAHNRVKHLYNIYSIIDILAIIPTISVLILPASAMQIGFFKIIRIFRVFRIFRFLRFTADPHFFFGNITQSLLKVFRLALTILIIFFISAGLFWYIEHNINPNVSSFGDAFYFTVVSLTTVGFGDITPVSEGGKWITILMILSGIILIPWQAGQIIKEWINISTKKSITCKKCGLKYHDEDASHCKSCGNIIYQEFEG